MNVDVHRVRKILATGWEKYFPLPQTYLQPAKLPKITWPTIVPPTSLWTSQRNNYLMDCLKIYKQVGCPNLNHKLQKNSGEVFFLTNFLSLECWSHYAQSYAQAIMLKCLEAITLNQTNSPEASWNEDQSNQYLNVKSNWKVEEQ